MLRAYKYRLYPSDEQKVLLEKHFGCARLIYNTGLLFRKYAWQGGMRVGYFDTARELIFLKKEFPFLKEVNSQSLQSSLKNLDTAFLNLFKHTGGYPNFKSKMGKQSFSCPQFSTVDFDKSELHIPKFKSGISIVLHRKFKGEIKTVTISRTPTKKYFASILVDAEVELPRKVIPSKEKAIGIDVGLKSFATVGNADLSRCFKIENPKYLVHNENLLARRQRQFGKKKKGSKNREKARLKLSRLHEKIVNQRNDFTNKISYRLVNDNQVNAICIEDLNVRGMMKNHKLARSIGDASWNKLFLQLKYKSDWTGKNILEAERFSPTSKKCSACGQKNNSLTLVTREWICPGCGAHHDRDENAVPNIIISAFDKYLKNRDGLPESTLGESSPLSSRKTLRRNAGTKNQEKFQNNSVLPCAS